MSNLTDALKVQYPHDVAELRRAIPLLQRFSDVEIEKLYDAFSDTHAAGWLCLSEETVESFKHWLEC